MNMSAIERTVATFGFPVSLLGVILLAVLLLLAKDLLGSTPWFKKRREERRQRKAERIAYFNAFPPDERLLGAPLYPMAVFDPEWSADCGLFMANVISYQFYSTDSKKRVVDFYETQLKAKASGFDKRECVFIIRSSPKDPESHNTLRVSKTAWFPSKHRHETAIVFGGYPDPTASPMGEVSRGARQKSGGPFPAVAKSIVYSLEVRFIAIPLAVMVAFTVLVPLTILLHLLSLNTPNGIFVPGAFALAGLAGIAVYAKIRRNLKEAVFGQEEQDRKDAPEKPQ